jgi:Endonuclease/Exonuclease/phosphatase family
VNGHDLVVLASHWTSRRDGGESGRTKYADQLYRRYKALHDSDPAVDLIICGDFNDDPDDSAVERNLHAVDDRDRLTGGREPLLYSLFGPRWSTAKGKFGTATYSNRWHLYDQIVVSPGLLDDRGWSVVEGSVAIAGDGMKLRNGRPWRFEDKQGDRYGYADHFPVTVRLKVAEK